MPQLPGQAGRPRALSQMSTRDMARAGKTRPVFLNPLRIRLPVGALTSVAHRVTGIFLALAVPAGIYLLDLSLQGPEAYAQVQGYSDKLAFRVASIFLVWVLAHHLLAGIRHLLSDLDIGSRLPVARRSAWIVNLGGVAVALLAAGALL